MDYVPLPRPGRLWKSKADFFKPFRSAASDVGENIAPLYDPEAVQAQDIEEPELSELNESLAALVDVFPDVMPEVFREMLGSVSRESRLQLVAEQVLKRKGKIAEGRMRLVRKQSASGGGKKGKQGKTGDLLLPEDTFRGEEYRKAVKQLLYAEFRNLSHSTIRGVMAEHNDSYSLARPTLLQISSKSWRFSLSSLWTRKSPSGVDTDHPGLFWQLQTGPAGDRLPAVKRTGSAILNRELYDLFVAPYIAKRKQDQLVADFTLANQVNEAEAEETGALYDCECCFSSVPFEQLATCDENCHYLCFDCIRRTTNEALYGQGWARSVDLNKSTLRCFASASHECHGAVPTELVKRALPDAREGTNLWLEFHKRVTSEALTKSRVPLQRCPFCVYAEVNEVQPPKLRTWRQINHYIAQKSSPGIQLLFLGALCFSILLTIPAFSLAIFIYTAIAFFPPASHVFRASWTRITTAHRTLRFTCLNPTCAQISCTRCLAPWHDPHTCFESEQTSLRTAIEASATAAIKRTCPKCLLSFVKASGCNKLVCNCGYTMCYICRCEITTREGYGHFCQHFRPSGGRCGECERCELYGDEDEEAAIRAAAERAEKTWREKGGENTGGIGAGEEARKAMVEALIGRKKVKWWEEWLDGVVDVLCE